VLVIFEQGGVSQHRTWDPKPDAPAEHRSPFKPIKTKADGVVFTELLRKTAQVADKLTVVRCMTQPTPGIATRTPKAANTSFPAKRPAARSSIPTSVPSWLTDGHRRPLSASNILLPEPASRRITPRSASCPRYAVFKTGGSPADPNWRVPNLGLLAGIDERRFKDRHDLLSALDVGYVNAGNRRMSRRCRR